MNQITLYRKGGRKPWVFEWNETYQYYVHKTRYNNRYVAFVDNPKRTSRLYRWYDSGLYYVDQNKVRADHFKLGNVTITF